MSTNSLLPASPYTPDQIDEAVRLFRLSPYTASLRNELIKLVAALKPLGPPGHEQETAQLWDYFMQLISNPYFSYQTYWANQ